MSASYSRKRKKSSRSEENIVSDIIYNINNIIEKINKIIETQPIKLPDMCEYGSSCYRKNPKHLDSFRHSTMNETYFVKLRDRIVLFNFDIIELLNLLHKQWALDPYFEKLDLKGLFKGAELVENDGKGKLRFVPEDTIYFYLLASIHSNLEMLVEKHPIYEKSNHFLLSLLMQMEENSVTGIYQLHENEYKTLFNVDNVMTETGVVIEDNGMISLCNTTLMMSLQENYGKPTFPELFTESTKRRKRRKTLYNGGRRTRKRNKRKCKTHKKRKTRRGRK